MTFAEFEALVSAAVADIPAEFRTILEQHGIPVIARDRQPRSLGRKTVVYGVFVGVPHAHEPAAAGMREPTRIEVYWRSFDGLSEQAARQEIARTVIHEIAHYFGFSEGAIRRLGY